MQKFTKIQKVLTGKIEISKIKSIRITVEYKNVKIKDKKYEKRFLEANLMHAV